MEVGRRVIGKKACEYSRHFCVPKIEKEKAYINLRDLAISAL